MFALLPCAVFAGRPVFHDLELAELVGMSDAVVVASPTQGFAVAARADASGCTAVSWPLKIIKVLVQRTPDAGGQSRGPRQALRLGVGQVVTVEVNPLAMVDCRIREAMIDGASFAARRFPSTLGQLERPPATAIYFLIERDGRLVLAAQGAIEGMSRLHQVKSAIARQPHGNRP